MKRSLLIVALVMIIWSTTVYANDIQSGFIITGPSELAIGETGEFVVSTSVKDAAGVQATLSIDDTIFELVNGELTGVWDAESNQDITVELIKVVLRAKESIDTNIETSLSLVEYKMARLTESVPPVEDVVIEGANYSVKVKVDKEIADKKSNNVADDKVVDNPNSSFLNSTNANNDAQSKIKGDNKILQFIIIIALLVLLSVLIAMLIRKNRNKRYHSR